MMEACTSPEYNSPTFSTKTFSYDEDLEKPSKSSNRGNSFSSGGTVNTTPSYASSTTEHDIESSLPQVSSMSADASSSIPTSLLSEEETLETLIQNSSAFLKDLDVSILGGHLSKIPRMTRKRTSKKHPISKEEMEYDNDLDDLLEDHDDDNEDDNNHHDEMLDDLSRLAAAEEDIRRELEMLMTTGFDDFPPPSNTTPSSSKMTSSNHSKSSDTDTDDDSESHDPYLTTNMGFDLSSSPTMHKSKHKRRKKKMLQSLSTLYRHDSDSDKEVLLDPSSSQSKPKSMIVDWNEHGEEIGIHRMMQEEIHDNNNVEDGTDVSKVYKCPLPNSIYDYIMDGEMERNTKDTVESNLEDSPTKQLFQELEIDDLDNEEEETKQDRNTPLLSSRQKEILLQCNSEYILPMTSKSLRTIYEGLLPPRTTTSSQAQRDNAQNSLTFLKDLVLERIPKIDILEKQFQEQHDNLHSNNDHLEPLPFRTCTLRIRPDVLCGAVMDTLSHIIMIERNGEIMKRQGGHLIAVLPGFWFKKKKKKKQNQMEESDLLGDDGAMEDVNEVEVVYNEDFNVFMAEHSQKKKKEKKKKRKVFLPPFCMDAQLCTKKRGSFAGDHCERILLIRFYEIREKVQAVAPMLDPEEEKNSEFGKENNEEVKEKYSDEYDLLRDAAYVLFQAKKEKKVLKTKQENDTTLPTDSDLLEDISLEDNAPKRDPSYVAQLGTMFSAPIRILSDAVQTPTVSSSFPKPPDKEEEKLINIFSRTNSNLYQSTFRFVTECISELETRELLYTTLLQPTTKFGTFPALPTLDVHYCSQLKSACREAMIMNLLKTASGLEQFAKHYETECLSFVRLLAEGVIREYGLPLPVVPSIVPLSGFPLDHESPEEKHPPWGHKVMDAMQKISLHSTTDATSESNATEINTVADFNQATHSAQMVVFAFCKQNDEELAARVIRKNLQVMDRMIKMQGLKGRCVESIRDIYDSNGFAVDAANRFNTLARQANILTTKAFTDFDEVSFSPAVSIEESAPKESFDVSEQVPLLKCGIVSNNAPGTCYVTAHQMLFVLNVGFLFGDEYYLVTISDIDLVVVKSPSNDSSETSVLSIRKRDENKEKRNSHGPAKNKGNHKELFSFTPSFPVDQFKKFFDTVRSIREEEKKK